MAVAGGAGCHGAVRGGGALHGCSGGTLQGCSGDVGWGWVNCNKSLHCFYAHKSGKVGQPSGRPATAPATRPADLLSAERPGHDWQVRWLMRAPPASEGRTGRQAGTSASGQAQGGSDPPPTGGTGFASRCDIPPHHTPPNRFYSVLSAPTHGARSVRESPGVYRGPSAGVRAFSRVRQDITGGSEHCNPVAC